MDIKQGAKLHKCRCIKDYEMEKDYEDQMPDIAFIKGKTYVFVEKDGNYVTISDGLTPTQHLLESPDIEQHFIKEITVDL